MKINRKKIKHTPIEVYTIQNKSIFVKREDLCTKNPAPPFSKVRGLFKFLSNLKKQGYTHVGYSENSISMASWGVSWVCYEIGLNAVIFDQQYKNPTKALQKHRQYWNKFNAKIIPVRPGIQNISFNIGKTYMRKNYKKGYMLPLGLSFDETVQETAKEFIYTINRLERIPKTLILSIGSGTICAGILNTKPNMCVFGITCSVMNENKKERFIAQKAKIITKGMIKQVNFKIIHGGYEYKEKPKIIAPFPCNPHYDLKAWEWLYTNINKIETPILFWNIGAE